MNDHIQPTDVTVEKTSAVQITYADGMVASFSLVDLRMNCPCAHCRSQRDMGRPAYGGDPTKLTVAGAETVGAWALQLVWMDGHSTGLYPWELLRSWAETSDYSLPSDSGL